MLYYYKNRQNNQEKLKPQPGAILKTQIMQAASKKRIEFIKNVRYYQNTLYDSFLYKLKKKKIALFTHQNYQQNTNIGKVAPMIQVLHTIITHTTKPNISKSSHNTIFQHVEIIIPYICCINSLIFFLQGSHTFNKFPSLMVILSNLHYNDNYHINHTSLKPVLIE